MPLVCKLGNESSLREFGLPPGAREKLPCIKTTDFLARLHSWVPGDLVVTVGVSLCLDSTVRAVYVVVASEAAVGDWVDPPAPGGSESESEEGAE